MNAETIAQTLNLGEFLGRDVLAVQLVILAATAALFVFSMAMMIMASRSAGSARQARLEAENYLRNAQDVVVEARQLSAQIDRAASGAKHDGAAPIRISARQTTPEADIEFLKHDKPNAVSSRDLDAAKESATVPKGLIGRSRRH